MEQEFRKKQNKKMTIFAVILSIVSIGLLVFGFMLVSSDKVVMLQSLSNLSSKIEGVFEDNDLLDKIAKNDNIGIKSNINLVSDYANAGLKFDYLENRSDKKSLFDIELSMNNQKLVGLDGAFANDNVYLYVDDITPNYYYTYFEYIGALNSLESNDYEKVIDLFKETLTDYIKEDDIEKSKVDITYNGKDKSVNKISYAVSNKVVSDLINNFLDSLEKDNKLLTKIAKYFGVTNEQMMTAFDNISKELTYTDVQTVCYYNVYYYGFNKIVRYELADVNNSPVIDYTVADKEIINLYSDNTVVMSLEVTNNKTQYDFTGVISNIDDGTKIPFSGNMKDDTLTINVKYNEVDIKLAITSTDEMKDNSYVNKNKIVLSGTAEGTEVTLGTLNVDLEYYFGEKINKDLSSSVDVNDITQNDLLTIQTNLMNHPLYQMIMSMSQGMDLGL